MRPHFAAPTVAGFIDTPMPIVVYLNQKTIPSSLEIASEWGGMTMKKVYEKPAIVYTELNGARAVVCVPHPPCKDFSD